MAVYGQHQNYLSCHRCCKKCHNPQNCQQRQRPSDNQGYQVTPLQRLANPPVAAFLSPT